MQSNRVAKWIVGALMAGVLVIVVVVVGYPLYRRIEWPQGANRCPPARPQPTERKTVVEHPVSTEFGQLDARARALGCRGHVANAHDDGFTCWISLGPCNCHMVVAATASREGLALVSAASVSTVKCSPGAGRHEMLTLLEPLIPPPDRTWFREFTARPANAMTLGERATKFVTQSQDRQLFQVGVTFSALQPASSQRDDTGVTVDVQMRSPTGDHVAVEGLVFNAVPSEPLPLQPCEASPDTAGATGK